MNWSVGFRASFYVGIVDPLTWLDSDRLEITSGSISKNNSDLRQSADVDCLNYSETTEKWIRIWMTANQNGSNNLHIPLFTGLASSPSKNINGNVITTPIQCYSVLKPAQDVLLPRGWYAPTNIGGDIVIRRLLRSTSAPINIEIEGEEAPKLKTAIIAEDGESNLSMIERILTSINWRMYISGDGTINVGPKPTRSVATFSTLENDILEPSLNVDYDWFSCPNVLRVVSDDVSAIARDDKEESILSVANRGREVWAEESASNLAENESLANYALRRLKEMQKVLTTISYTRRFDPNINIEDIVSMDYPKQSLKGDYRIKSQTIDLGPGARISEEVEQVI